MIEEGGGSALLGLLPEVSLMSYVNVVRDEAARFAKFPRTASLGQRNYSVTNVAMVTVEWFEAGNPLPLTVDQIVEGAYRPDWYQKLFYAVALAEMIHKGWLALDGETVVKTDRYPEALNYAAEQRVHVEAFKAATEVQSRKYAEGRRKALGSLPQGVQKVIESAEGHSGYERNWGVSIDSRNYGKRVVPGVEARIEFGKRHFSYDSEVTGRRETTSGNFYVPGKVVESDGRRSGKVKVEVAGEVYEIEGYRISQVRV